MLPALVLEVLCRFKVGDDRAAGVGVEVRNDQDVLVAQVLVCCVGGRVVASLAPKATP